MLTKRDLWKSSNITPLLLFQNSLSIQVQPLNSPFLALKVKVETRPKNKGYSETRGQLIGERESRNSKGKLERKLGAPGDGFLQRRQFQTAL